jgi:hypothetical protein
VVPTAANRSASVSMVSLSVTMKVATIGVGDSRAAAVACSQSWRWMSALRRKASANFAWSSAREWTSMRSAT